MLTRHYTARRGVGLSEILSCGEDYEAVVREALKYERHPSVIEILPGGICPRCWFEQEGAAKAEGWE